MGLGLIVRKHLILANINAAAVKLGAILVRSYNSTLEQNFTQGLTETNFLYAGQPDR